VHFVGVIIVWLSTCTEGQQLKFNFLIDTHFIDSLFGTITKL
jgi:hypothetical protein